MNYFSVQELHERGRNDRLAKAMLGEYDDTFLPQVSELAGRSCFILRHEALR